MAPTDNHGADLQQAEKPDVDSLLDTLQRNTSDTLKNFTESDNSRHLRTGGRAWGS